MAYDAFISYSHAADGKLAPAIQSGLQRFARPWWKTRILRVFRDETGLSVNPDLWDSIRAALDDSEWFVLLASPDAAASPWVERELEHWLASHSADHVLLIVTDGTWEWDAHTNDFTATSTAVPAALHGRFDREPRHLDLRWARSDDDLDLRHSEFRRAIADVAAPIHGLSKDEMESEEIGQHRRTVRLAQGVGSTIVLLLVVAIVTSTFAFVSANNARRSASDAKHQTRVARSRAFTLASVQELAKGDTDTALLLAVEAVRLDDNPQSHAALYAAPQHTRGYLHGIGHVTALTTSGDENTVAAINALGRVVRWDVGTLQRKAANPPTDPHMQLLALNHDGSLVATARRYSELFVDSSAVKQNFHGLPALKIWDAQTRMTRTIAVSGGDDGVATITFDSHSDRLAVVQRNGISVIDARTGNRVSSLPWRCDFFGARGCPLAVAFDASARRGGRLAVGSLRWVTTKPCRCNDIPVLDVEVSVWTPLNWRRIAGPFSASDHMYAQSLSGATLQRFQVGLRGNDLSSLVPIVDYPSFASLLPSDDPSLRSLMPSPGAPTGMDDPSLSSLTTWAVLGDQPPIGEPQARSVLGFSGSGLIASEDVRRHLHLRASGYAWQISPAAMSGIENIDIEVSDWQGIGIALRPVVPATTFSKGRFLLALRSGPIEVVDPVGTEQSRHDLIVERSPLSPSDRAPGTTLDIDTSAWVSVACAVANRNFTREEWVQYAGEGVPYEEVCPNVR